MEWLYIAKIIAMVLVYVAAIVATVVCGIDSMDE